MAQAGTPETSFKMVREHQGIVAAGLIALDAARRAAPALLKVVQPELKSRAANAALEKVSSVTTAPDAGALAALGSWYAYAAASDPDELPYDLSFWRACVSVTGTALGTWLMARGSRHAWKVFAGTGTLATIMSGAQTRLHDCYVTRTWRPSSVRDIIFNSVMPFAHGTLGILGLASARSGSELLVSRVARLVPAPLAAHWPQLRRLGLYFMVFSLVGHWGEMLFCTAIKYGLVGGEYDRSNRMLWDQWLYPFPAEGSVAVLMALFLHPAKQVIHAHARQLWTSGIIHKFAAAPLALFATFLLNQAVCTTIDYTTGIVANRNYELWDYREMPYNFQGQICLQNSLIYSAIATWAVWRLFPRMERGMELAGDTVLNGAFVGLGSFFAFLELLYLVIPPRSQRTKDGDGAAQGETAEAGCADETASSDNA